MWRVGLVLLLFVWVSTARAAPPDEAAVIASTKAQTIEQSPDFLKKVIEPSASHPIVVIFWSPGCCGGLVTLTGPGCGQDLEEMIANKCIYTAVDGLRMIEATSAEFNGRAEHVYFEDPGFTVTNVQDAYREGIAEGLEGSFRFTPHLIAFWKGAVLAKMGADMGESNIRGFFKQVLKESKK